MLDMSPFLENSQCILAVSTAISSATTLKCSGFAHTQSVHPTKHSLIHLNRQAASLATALGTRLGPASGLARIPPHKAPHVTDSMHQMTSPATNSGTTLGCSSGLAHLLRS